jgi:ectoine hydroxylase-related dioxygenase (phytanoyl-CoA dioxygenase family)
MKPPLSEPQIQHYFREGYVLVPALVPMRTIRAVMKHATTRLKDGDFWQPTSLDFAHPEIDAQIHQIIGEPRIVAAARQLLGSPPRAWWGMLAIVPPRGGRGLPWHQDNQYTHILGGALNVFIALADIEPNMATLWVAPRSHLSGVRPAQKSEAHHGHRESLEAPDNALQLPPLKAGDTCIFDRNTLHRSLTNESDTPRYAYAAQYMSDHAREAATGQRNETRPRAADLAKKMKAWLRSPTSPLAGEVAR